MSNCVSRGLYRDWNKANGSRLARSASFTVTSLTKAGVPSKMSDANTHFRSEQEAVEWVALVRSLNAGRTLRFTLNGTEI